MRTSIYRAPPKEVRRIRRGTILGGLVITAVAATVFFLTRDYSSFGLDDIAVLLLGELTMLPLYVIGLKQNYFEITTDGIFPAAKPFSMLFSGRYFVPYSDIVSMEIEHRSYWNAETKKDDTHPHACYLHLKNGKTVWINVLTGFAPLYMFIHSETMMRGVYRMLEAVKVEIESQRMRGMEEIVMSAEKLKEASRPRKDEHYAD
jgi:hypothetical protein